MTEKTAADRQKNYRDRVAARDYMKKSMGVKSSHVVDKDRVMLVEADHPTMDFARYAVWIDGRYGQVVSVEDYRMLARLKSKMEDAEIDDLSRLSRDDLREFGLID